MAARSTCLVATMVLGIATAAYAAAQERGPGRDGPDAAGTAAGTRAAAASEGLSALALEDDPADWTVCPTGATTEFHAVAWGGGRFLAVGEYGPSRTSSDGLTWSGPAEWTGGLFTDVAWYGAEFVAVGRGSAIATTVDGVVWRFAPSPTSAELYSVAWNGSRVVIVGGPEIGLPEESVILSGPDPWTLSEQKVPADGPLLRVRWLGGRFVAVGMGAILTSADGQTWSPATSGCGTLLGVAWDGVRLVAVGTPTYCPGWCNDLAAVSLDGFTWSCSYVAQWPNGLTDVISDGRRFLAVGAFGAIGDAGQDATALILTSADGVAWTAHATKATYGLLGLASNGRRTVAVGFNGTILAGAETWPRVPRRHVAGSGR